MTKTDDVRAARDVTMVHDLGCLTGAALSLALGSEAHDAR